MSWLTRDPDGEPIAALLANVLRSDDWNAPPPHESAEDERREDMAAKAVQLYRKIEPISHAAIGTDDEASSVECAAAALGEIADGYALQATTWEQHELGAVPIPSRESVEAFIYAQGIDLWSTALGHPLLIRTTASDLPEVSEPENSRIDGDVPDLSAVAATFGDTVRAYGKMLSIYEREEGRDILRSRPWREKACRQVASSRVWSLWVRDRLGLVGPYAALAVATFDIGRGCFLLSWDTSGASPFATRAYVRDLLRKGAADRWLILNGADLPTWIRTES